MREVRSDRGQPKVPRELQGEATDSGRGRAERSQRRGRPL